MCFVLGRLLAGSPVVSSAIGRTGLELGGGPVPYVILWGDSP